MWIFSAITNKFVHIITRRLSIRRKNYQFVSKNIFLTFNWKYLAPKKWIHTLFKTSLWDINQSQKLIATKVNFATSLTQSANELEYCVQHQRHYALSPTKLYPTLLLPKKLEVTQNFYATCSMPYAQKAVYIYWHKSYSYLNVGEICPCSSKHAFIEKCCVSKVIKLFLVNQGNSFKHATPWIKSMLKRMSKLGSIKTDSQELSKLHLVILKLHGISRFWQKINILQMLLYFDFD